LPTASAQELARLWDVVIVGAGMGGGFTARALAEAGYEVLLLDRGNRDRGNRERGNRDRGTLERTAAGVTGGAEDADLAESKWPGPSACEVDGAVSRHYGIFGAGVGGSTNLYAAALERFSRHDVESTPLAPHPTGGWLVTYDQLLPWYVQAERMLHVAGTRDPLNPDSFDHLHEPPALGPVDTQLMQSFADSGMHPYRLHVGIRYVPGCDECLSKLCLRKCRADARSVVAEGLKQPTIVERSEAVRLEAGEDSVTSVILRKDGVETAVRARVFVLAAGAVHTPKLILNSRGQHWPDGVANRNGMVGRNLMFHAGLRFIMWPRKKHASSGPRKSLCFRDFYFHGGQRLGAVQSSGFEAGYGDLLVHLYGEFDRGPLRRLRILRPFLRIPAKLTAAARGRGTIFSAIIEDLPYADNRVVLESTEADGVLMKYTVRPELRDRVERLQDLLRQHLDKRRTIFPGHGVELNLSHACGTCTMGADPAASVVDRDCRAHGIANLFITDASFMPTSAAINPSLTIAANALRVSESIKRVLAESK
jgi:choline dehydrogenase-like flavoprotein